MPTHFNNLLKKANTKVIMNIMAQSGFLTDNGWGGYFINEDKFKDLDNDHYLLILNKLDATNTTPAHQALVKFISEQAVRSHLTEDDVQFYVEAYNKPGKIERITFNDEILPLASAKINLEFMLKTGLLYPDHKPDINKLNEESIFTIIPLVFNLGKEFDSYKEIIESVCTVSINPGSDEDDKRSALLMTHISNRLVDAPDQRWFDILGKMAEKADDDIIEKYLWLIGYLNMSVGTSVINKDAIEHLPVSVRLKMAAPLKKGLTTSFEKQAIKDLEK
ncbi:MAG: hypothetical protein ABII90_04970 [Bacteroidota bacterium]